MAGALSRRDIDTFKEDASLLQVVDDTCSSPVSTCCIVSFPTPTWLADLKASYESNQVVQGLLQSLQEGKQASKGFSLQNGFSLYKGRLYLGSQGDLKTIMLQQIHNRPLRGHSRYLKSLHKLQQDFYWLGMKKDLKMHIQECDTCQKDKTETCKSTGLL